MSKDDVKPRVKRNNRKPEYKNIAHSEFSIQEFLIIFTDTFSEDYLLKIKCGGDNVFCPYCGVSNSYVTDRGFKCSSAKCGKKFTVRTNTIFEGSKIGIEVWFFIIYMIASNKKNISSRQLSRNFGITQKTAWGLMMKIRQCLTQENLVFSGVVEIDEAFISKADWHKWGFTNVRKTPVIGIYERDSKRVFVHNMENRSKDEIVPIIEKHVEQGSTIYTDGYRAYRNLKNFTHDFVNHKEREFVRGNVHTNSIENFWGFFKRNVKNIHHSISNKHLQSYLNESVFKFNNRDKTQIELFNLIIKNCIFG